jgi:ketopantoate reductase
MRIAVVGAGGTGGYFGGLLARAANNGVLCMALLPRRYMNGLDGGYTEPSKGE